ALPRSRDQLHIGVHLVVRPDHPEHVMVRAAVAPGRIDQRNWGVRHRDAEVLHEVLHYVGLPDEYPDETSLFRRPGRRSGFPGRGVMTAALDWESGLPGRYARIIEDVVDSGPVVPDHRWDAAATEGMTPRLLNVEPDDAPGQVVARAPRAGALDLGQLGSAVLQHGQYVVGRDFTVASGRALLADPFAYVQVRQGDTRPGSQPWVPINPSRRWSLPAQGGYLVHAHTPRGQRDRIEVYGVAGDARQLTFAEFGGLVAADPYLVRMPAGAPVLVAVPATLHTNLDLLRAVRDASGRQVWGHTGAVLLFPDQSELEVRIGEVQEPILPRGQWVTLPTMPQVSFTRQMPGRIRSLDGEEFDDTQVILRPFADPSGRIAGHWSVAYSHERTAYVSAYLKETGFQQRAADGSTVLVRRTGEVPWAGLSQRPYLLMAHGKPGYVALRIADGRDVKFSGDQVGRLLRRRQSFTELFHGRPIAALACYAAASPQPPVAASFIQDLANATGRQVFGAPNILGITTAPRGPWSGMSIRADEVTGEERGWQLVAPEEGPLMDALANKYAAWHNRPVPTQDDRRRAIHRIRDNVELFGRNANYRTFEALVALEILWRHGHHQASGDFTKNDMKQIARMAYGRDALSANVTDHDLRWLIQLIERFNPVDLTALQDIAHQNPPTPPDRSGLLANPIVLRPPLHPRQLQSLGDQGAIQVAGGAGGGDGS
ncbi:hypothetical protein ACWEQ3_49810, partial [Streptomyces mirabilis]